MKTPIPRSFPKEPTARLMETNAAAASRDLAARALVSGRVVGYSRVTDGEYKESSDIIGLDDSVPESDEGTPLLEIPYTAKAAGNQLIINSVVNISYDTAAFVIAFILLDNEDIARAVGMDMVDDTNRITQVVVSYVWTATDTRNHVWKVYGGGHTAGTIGFNGRSGSRLFGGKLVSYVEVVEVAA